MFSNAQASRVYVFLNAVGKHGPYTRAKVFAFVTNPTCFDIGFILTFTLTSMIAHLITDRLRILRRLLNPEQFAGSLFEGKYESESNNKRTSFPKRIRTNLLFSYMFFKFIATNFDSTVKHHRNTTELCVKICLIVNRCVRCG